MNGNPVAIARTCYEAYVRKDRPAIEALIAGDFHFTSPLDNRIDRITFERCWPVSQNIKTFDFVYLTSFENKALVTYEGTNVNGSRFRNTEIVTIRGQQISQVEVYFGWNIPHKAPLGEFADV